MTTQAVTLTAIVTGQTPTGTVTFYDGTTVLGTSPLAGGVATLSYAFATAGAHSLTATYGGNTNNTSSTSAAVAQNVVTATATALTATPSPATAGQAITLTATVTGQTPTGTVTFYDGTTALGSGTVTAGTATLSYTFNSVGTHSLTAGYRGDTNNQASTSPAVSLTVNPGATVTTLAAYPNPTIIGQPVNLSANVTGGNPSGTVTFYDGTTALGTGTVTAGVATLSYTFTSASTHSLTATYSGDTNNQGSTSAALTETVNATAVMHAYNVYSDHLGTPREITDTSGNLVWQWDNTDPYGNNVPNENPSNQGQFSFNLRFPGQYADVETNTHYNINRDYDPATGRYVESDPIGLEGGINTYAYVENNPLSYVDPLGLSGDDLTDPGVSAGPYILMSDASEEAKRRLAIQLQRWLNNLNRQKTYQTYTRYNPKTHKCYSGRTSGYDDPETNIRNRAYGQPLLNAEGFNPPVLDRSSTDYSAIRGREQQLIEINGGAQSERGTSRNMINGISIINPFRITYLEAAILTFGVPVAGANCTCH